MSKTAVLATVFAIAIVTTAEAKTYRTSATMPGAVAMNGRMFAGPFSTVDAYCRSSSTAAISIMQRPRHGVLSLGLGNGEINMRKGSNLARCNDLQTRGSFVSYTPRKNFRGSDVFKVLLSFEDGERRTVTFPVTVR